MQEPAKFIEVPRVDQKTAAVEMAGLEDVVMPPPISYWPQTEGWYVLGALVVALAGWLVWRQVQRWRARAYRRDALRELDGLHARLREAAARPAALREVAAIVKRTQLAERPREAIAPLSGSRWHAELSSDAGLPDTAARLLVTVSSARDAALAALPAGDVDSLVASVRAWVSRHHARVR